MSVSNLDAKESELNNSTYEWKNEITELEMIQAAKMILLNRNPEFYLKKIHDQKNKLIHFDLEKLKKDFPLEENQKEVKKPKLDPISSFRYDQNIASLKKRSNNHLKPASIVSLLAERWTNDNRFSDKNYSGEQSNQNVDQNRGNILLNWKKSELSAKKLEEEENINEGFKKAIKVLSKNQPEKHFAEEFIEKIESFFEGDPALIYLRLTGDKENIEGKKIDTLTYNVFNFFEFRKNNDFLQFKTTKKAIENFFKLNFYEKNELSRTNDVLFYANKIGGNLWKIKKNVNNNFDIWLQRETNAAVDNSHFRFGAHFASKKSEDFNFRIWNISDELGATLSQMYMFSRTNGENWHRNILCTFQDKMLHFMFTKMADVEQAEFSLFLPTDITRSIESLIRKNTRKEEKIEKEIKITSLQKIEKMELKNQKNTLPEIITSKLQSKISEKQTKNTSQDRFGKQTSIINQIPDFQNKILDKNSDKIIPSGENQPILKIKHSNKNKVLNNKKSTRIQLWIFTFKPNSEILQNQSSKWKHCSRRSPSKEFNDIRIRV